MSIDKIEVGDIIHFFNEDIGKNKFHICVCIAKNYFLVINTENRRFYDCIEIKSKDYYFLKGTNRFIECARIFKQDLDVAENIAKKGKILKKDLEKILNKIKDSPRIEEYQKELIIFDIENFLNSSGN